MHSSICAIPVNSIQSTIHLIHSGMLFYQLLISFFCNPLVIQVEGLLNLYRPFLDSPSPYPRKFSSFDLVRKITITPTRIIFRDSVAVAKNRVLREFPADAFVLVDFTDEEGQSLNGGDNCVMDRVAFILVCAPFLSNSPSFPPFPSSSPFFLPSFLPLPTLHIFKYFPLLTRMQESGLKLHDRTFHFIFGNARKGSCWFSLHTVDELNLGDFSCMFLYHFETTNFLTFNSAIQNPGKILARRGLAFASSTPTVTLPTPITREMVKPDIICMDVPPFF